MKRTFYIILLLLFLTLIGRAQDLTVASFTTSTNVDASVHQVNDLSGQACALVKVFVTDELLEAKGPFVISQEGNRSVTKHGPNEYWVYLAHGAKNLTVATRNYKPLQLWFRDYNVPMLQSKVTYHLSLNADSPAKKQRLTIKYSPADAVVLIDSKVCQGQNGTYQTTLAPGNYKVVVTHSGYNPFDVTAEIKDAPVSFYAYLDKTAAPEEAATPQNITAPQAVTPQTSTTPQTTRAQESSDEQSVNLSSSNPDDRSFTVNGVTFTMVHVDGGTFTMGGTTEQGRDVYSDEKRTHSVTLSSYYIGQTEVTQALWEAVMGSNPSNWKGRNLPVEQVSWEDCQNFVRELNRMTGKNFRLPTEAEWEYAARGGNKTTGCKYSGSNAIDKVAWYDGNSGSKTHEVKTKSPNEQGIYDMSGNVYEWCQDWFGSYSSSPQTNPTGASSGSYRVNRGGGWDNFAWCCRVSDRYIITPSYRNYFLGLRLAL